MKLETSPDPRCVLVVDPGKTYGVAVVSFDNRVLWKEEYKFTGQKAFYKNVKFAVGAFHPAAIVHGLPCRYPAVIASQSKMIGIIDLVAEEHDIYTVPCFDSKVKATILGKGHGFAKKEEIMARYGETSEHIADCLMFAEYFLSFQDKEL